jgi:lactoylglutathione lyase
MASRMTYVMVFVSNMDESVRFFRDTLGLTLKYQTPYWSEFFTGETTLALHPASEKNPPGKIEIGIGVDGVKAFYEEARAKGIKFTQAPRQEAGALLARFLSPDGMEISVGDGKVE